jgi:hypothetical protein
VLEKFWVQQILKKRLSAAGAPEYHTLWEGYLAAEATWEPEESFAGCRGLLAAFERGLEPVAAEVAEPPQFGRRRQHEPHDTGWMAQLARLAGYKVEHGDCNVPKRWAEDPRLGSWVNTQRKLKRTLDRGEHSPVTTTQRAGPRTRGWAAGS